MIPMEANKQITRLEVELRAARAEATYMRRLAVGLARWVRKRFAHEFMDHEMGDGKGWELVKLAEGMADDE